MSQDSYHDQRPGFQPPHCWRCNKVFVGVEGVDYQAITCNECTWETEATFCVDCVDKCNYCNKVFCRMGDYEEDGTLVPFENIGEGWGCLDPQSHRCPSLKSSERLYRRNAQELPRLGWAIVHASGDLVKDGLGSPGEAHQWLIDNAGTLGDPPNYYSIVEIIDDDEEAHPARPPGIWGSPLFGSGLLQEELEADAERAEEEDALKGMFDKAGLGQEETTSDEDVEDWGLDFPEDLGLDLPPY